MRGIAVRALVTVVAGAGVWCGGVLPAGAAVGPDALAGVAPAAAPAGEHGGSSNGNGTSGKPGGGHDRTHCVTTTAWGDCSDSPLA
jgi:hypothetical protein